MIEECISVFQIGYDNIIFGAGVGGAILYKILKKYNLTEHILGWSDNNRVKHNLSYMEERLKIIPPNNLNKIDKKINVIIASSAYPEIREQLCDIGIEKDRIFLFNFAFMDVDYTDCNFIWDNIDSFERAYKKMSDYKSKKIFEDILNYRISKEQSYLMDMQKYTDDEKDQYFPEDLIEFSKEECFLDIGAYTGDTYESFLNLYNNYEYYYGIEADYDRFCDLRKVISQNSKDYIYNVAAWNGNTELNFEINPGSTCAANGSKGNKVKAVILDELLCDNKVTFVKMDIEGAELYALEGIKKIIRNYHPILALCVYHKRDDFYKLTDYVEEVAPNVYNFYLRQYRYTPTETVCYAVPKNRRK